MCSTVLCWVTGGNHMTVEQYCYNLRVSDFAWQISARTAMKWIFLVVRKHRKFYWFGVETFPSNSSALLVGSFYLWKPITDMTSPVPTSGTVCQRMWPPLHHCRCSDNAWRQFCSTAAIRTYVLSELCFPSLTVVLAVFFILRPL